MRNPILEVIRRTDLFADSKMQNTIIANLPVGLRLKLMDCDFSEYGSGIVQTEDNQLTGWIAQEDVKLIEGYLGIREE